MKNSAITKQSMSLALLCSSLTFLPGCMDWFTCKKSASCCASDKHASPSASALVEDGSRVVAWIGDGGDNKEVILTEKRFNDEFEALVNENPQVKQLLPFMPDIKKNFLNGLVNQELVTRYIERQGITQTEEYQRELARMDRAMRQMLNAKFFSQAYPVQVSDKETKEFYEKHKAAIPDLLISRGGVAAVGIEFAKEADAKTFYEKAKAKPADFEKLAKEANLADKVTDYKMVHLQTVGVDGKIKAKLFEMTKFPAVELVAGGDKKFYVVKATSKEEPKYHAYEDVKMGLEKLVQQEKQKEVLQKAIDGLKKEYGVTIDEEFLSVKEAGDKNAPAAVMPQEAAQEAVAEQKA